ncbi:MAG: hypothetical protein ACRC1F_02850 [Metamycoplasmataceae bacterium]
MRNKYYKINVAWKDYKVVVKQVEINGKISGTFEGELETMEKSEKTTMNDLLKVMNKGFECMDKKIETMDKKIETMDKKIETMDKKIETIRKDMDKGFQNVNNKIDLILATPTIQKEIDQKALSKLN